MSEWIERSLPDSLVNRHSYVVASLAPEMTSPPAESPESAQYDAGATEPALYEAWERNGVFTADPKRSNRVGETGSRSSSSCRRRM